VELGKASLSNGRSRSDKFYRGAADTQKAPVETFNVRSRSAANAMQASTSSCVSCGKSSSNSASLLPAARLPRTSPTVSRVPRTHGLPKRMAGLNVMHRAGPFHQRRAVSGGWSCCLSGLRGLLQSAPAAFPFVRGRRNCREHSLWFHLGVAGSGWVIPVALVAKRGRFQILSSRPC